MTTRVSRILRSEKGVVQTGSETSVMKAIRLMIDSDVGAIVVVDENQHLAGIFTERDLLRRIVAAGLDPDSTLVGDVMTKNVRTVDGTATRQEVRTLMEEEHIRHVPIVDGETLLGVVSLRDVLRSDNAEKEFEINQLKDYVSHKPYPKYPA